MADPAVDSQTLDDLFDAVARYFPINFTPPKNDANKITPDLLQGLLRKCMLATPRLCNLFLPFLLEKLAAKSPKTKIQCLNLICDMIESFTFGHFAENLSSALSEVSQLYFNRVDEEVQPHAARAVGVLLDASLSKGTDHLEQKGVSVQHFAAGECHAFI